MRRAGRCSSSSTAPAATRTSSVELGARAAARGDDRLAARRCLGTRRGALLPPHRRGRLRHGRPRARDGEDGRLRRAHVEAAKPSAVLGLGYSNGANILASVLFATPDLFDAAVLMHPLIPFEPEVKGGLAGKPHPDHRRPPRSDLPAEPDRRGSKRICGRRAPMSQWNGTRAATRCGRTRSRRPGGFFAGVPAKEASDA